MPSSTPIDDVDRDHVLATIRDVFADREPRRRNEAIRDVAYELGYGRVGQRISVFVSNAIRTAVRRGILESTAGKLHLHTWSIKDYRQGFLVSQLLTGMGYAWWHREDLIDTTARWLGFRRTGNIIRARIRSAINGAIRRGLLEAEGDWVRRVR